MVRDNITSFPFTLSFVLCDDREGYAEGLGRNALYSFIYEDDWHDFVLWYGFKLLFVPPKLMTLFGR